MTFNVDQNYTRIQIAASVGGGLQSCLVRAGGGVVAVCFTRSKNPRGPEEIFVGRGPSKEAAAELLAAQADAVPAFEKSTTGAWRYIGNFRGGSYVTRSDAISEAKRASGRSDIAGILRLTPVV